MNDTYLGKTPKRYTTEHDFQRWLKEDSGTSSGKYRRAKLSSIKDQHYVFRE